MIEGHTQRYRHPAICPQCGKEFLCRVGDLNRAERIGAPRFCGIKCAGLSHRLRDPPTEEERKAKKKAYDEQRRKDKASELKIKKAEYYKRTANRDKEREIRQKNMHKHVEYCRRPEYKEYKSEYDQMYRAKKFYGEFYEAAIALINLETEVAERVEKVDRAIAKGTLNKSQTRKREYERLNSN